MTHRFFGFLALFLALFVSSCSWIGKRWPQYHELEAQPFDLVGDPVPSGTKRTTKHWSCADDGTGGWFCAGHQPQVVAAVDNSTKAAPRAERQGVAPDVLAALDSFIAGTDPVGPDNSVMVKPPVTPPLKTDRPAVPSGNTSDAYVLQIAAYRSQFSAERRLNALATPGLEIARVGGIVSDFFVIVSPQYATSSAAEAAGRELQSKHQGVDFWVRRKGDIDYGGDDTVPAAAEPEQQIASAVVVYPLQTAKPEELAVEPRVYAEPDAVEINVVERKEDTLADELAAWAVEESPKDEPPIQQVASAETSTAMPSAADSAYVLQLAAYRLRAAAEEHLQELAIPGAEIVRVTGVIGDFYAILSGRFTSKASALDGALQLSKSRPGVDYWVRPLRDVEPLLTQQATDTGHSPPQLALARNGDEPGQLTAADSDALAMPATSYVLQLAAYRSLASAQKRLDVLRVPGSEIVKTRSYYVILAGSYPAKEQAQAAGDVLRDGEAKLDFWIRDSSELQFAGMNTSP